jgi:hypothetical protein
MRCLEDFGFARGANTVKKVAFCGVESALGEAECAATQTVHFIASVAFEWWWATKATTDQKVSTTQKSATVFENDRMSMSNCVSRIYTETGSERNEGCFMVTALG